MITLRNRIEKIKTTDDAAAQMRLAKQYARRLRNEAKQQNTLAEKLAHQEKAKQAENILRELRKLIFDIEDALAEDKAAESVLS